MATVTLRFYEELNDFLPPERRKRDLVLSFQPPCPVRHLVELCGVPHTEVELVLRNGRSVDLDQRVADRDRLSVYPMFESLDVTPLVRLREAPLRNPRFLADAHLGRLARYLRLLGFDTQFQNDLGDAALASRAAAEGLILLTRDRGLLMRREVTHGCFIRTGRPLEQLEQVMRRCDLYPRVRPFSRCMECNGLVHPVDKAEVSDKLPPATRRHYRTFWLCARCGRVYWKGSHYARLEALVHRVAEDLRQDG
jgi:uncharacterized protein with PIN domain